MLIEDLLQRAVSDEALPHGLGDLPCDVRPRVVLDFARGELVVGYACVTCDQEGPIVEGELGPAANGVWEDALSGFLDLGCGKGEK